MAGKGIVWERVCNNSRDRLAQDGDLAWCRMHPPVLKVGPGLRTKRGSFLAVRTGKGPPDWCAITKHKHIIGDDKDCKKAPWYSKQVKTHQASIFDAYERFGATAVILLRMPDKSRRCVPWSLLRKWWEVGTSFHVDELEDIGAFQWQKKCDNEPAYDWLTPLLERCDA